MRNLRLGRLVSKGAAALPRKNIEGFAEDDRYSACGQPYFYERWPWSTTTDSRCLGMTWLHQVVPLSIPPTEGSQRNDDCPQSVNIATGHFNIVLSNS